MLFHSHFRWQVDGTARSYGTVHTAMELDVLLLKRGNPFFKRLGVF